MILSKYPSFIIAAMLVAANVSLASPFMLESREACPPAGTITPTLSKDGKVIICDHFYRSIPQEFVGKGCWKFVGDYGAPRIFESRDYGVQDQYYKDISEEVAKAIKCENIASGRLGKWARLGDDNDCKNTPVNARVKRVGADFFREHAARLRKAEKIGEYLQNINPHQDCRSMKADVGLCLKATVLPKECGPKA
ncbi:hypothetical protein BJ508DRAFT_377936 [Ascobolus immersus RN42]|uniref:Uncharacterized protein n=1 Tax=Ascobolus immersus RN42 TaxID=1160509 RepID=A0A3N4I492_ASCIM|nr:hypothetical protein BJ508DRAFT_377936 [Ascobolus immersus RN42]